MGVLLSVAVLLSFHNARAKSYRIEEVKIFARILPDGDLAIREERTYRFRGTFRWADYRLPVRGFSAVSDFRLEENGRAYRPGLSGKSGTFQLRREKGEFYVKWFYRARNETRTFTLSFRLKNAVAVYADVAELYYKFVGGGWEMPARRVRVEIELPPGARKKEIYAWVHGPLWGNIVIPDSSRVTAEAAPLPKRTFFEVRLLFPPRLVPGAGRRFAGKRLQIVLAREKRWAEQANAERLRAKEELARRQARKRVWVPAAAVLSLLALLLAVLLFRRYGKNPPAHFKGRFFSELPSDLPPALVSCLLNRGSVYASALFATLLDLARRGLLTVEERRKTGRSLFRRVQRKDALFRLDRRRFEREAGSLAPFERSALQFLFGDIAGGKDQVSLTEIGRARSRMRRWFSHWRKEIQAAAKARSFFDPGVKTGRRYELWLASGLLLFSFPVFYFAEGAGILPLAASVLIFIFALLLHRITPEYADEYAKWRALGRYLRKYHFERGRTETLKQLLDAYLVYGLVLGLTPKRIRELLQLIPEETARTRLPWYLYAGTGSPEGVSGSFAESISGLVATANSSLSSATGAGGGASAGGGGGGGGSGGGAG